MMEHPSAGSFSRTSCWQGRKKGICSQKSHVVFLYEEGYADKGAHIGGGREVQFVFNSCSFKKEIKWSIFPICKYASCHRTWYHIEYDKDFILNYKPDQMTIVESKR